MKMKKLAATVLSAAMALSCFGGMAMAEDATEYANGTYKATVHFHNYENPTNYSMCDAIFAHEADVTLTDESATVTVYVAYPIPAFPSLGTDGTILNTKAVYNETEYTATIDVDTKPEKTFDTTNTLFKINEGDSLPTEVVTFTMPRDAIDTFLSDGGMHVETYVNAVMNSNQKFYVKLTNLTAQKTEEPETPKTEESEGSMQITGKVEAPTPSYTVTIPESIDMGTLSVKEANSKDYTVNVKAEYIGTGSITVAGQASGNLAYNNNLLPFANSFGTQTVTGTADVDTINQDLTGTISVTAADALAAAKAAPGNYTGTTTFAITYTPAA